MSIQMTFHLKFKFLKVDLSQKKSERYFSQYINNFPNASASFLKPVRIGR